MFKHTLSLVASAALVASLEANTLKLEPIVVSASKSEQSLKNVTADIDVITAQEIEERHYASLIEALNSLSGISFTQSGGIGQQSSLYVRGFANNYTLILIDGVRMNDPTNFTGAFLDQIALSDVQQIEIVKGAQSGIWGADAAAGVINIITQKAKPHHIDAYLESGSYGTRKMGTTLSHVFEGGDIKLGFDRLIIEGFSAAEPKKSNALYGHRYNELGWESDPYSSTTLHAKGGWNFSDNDRLEWSHRYVVTSQHFDNSGADSLTNSNRFTQRFNKLSYSHKSDRNDIQAYGGRSDFERSYYGGYRGNTDEVGLKDTIAYQENGSLTGGLSWQRFVVDRAAGTLIDNSYVGRAVFASNTNVFNNRTTIVTETIRYDDYSLFGSKITGKMGVKQMLDEGSVGINYGTAYQAPAITQIFNPYGAANLDLKPENICSFDATGTYKNVSLTYFYNTIEDMISWYDPTPSNFFNSDAYYTNADGKTLLQGYEAKGSYSIGDVLVLGASYSKLYTKSTNGKLLPGRAHESLKMTTDWYPSSSLHVGINAQYIGQRYNDTANTIETGDYAIFGTVLNYALTSNVDLYAKIDNMFDRYYQNVDGYATAGRSGYFGVKIDY